MATVEALQMKVSVDDRELKALPGKLAKVEKALSNPGTGAKPLQSRLNSVIQVNKGMAETAEHPPRIATPGVLTQKTLGISPGDGLYCS